MLTLDPKPWYGSLLGILNATAVAKYCWTCPYLYWHAPPALIFGMFVANRHNRSRCYVQRLASRRTQDSQTNAASYITHVSSCQNNTVSKKPLHVLLCLLPAAIYLGMAFRNFHKQHASMAGQIYALHLALWHCCQSFASLFFIQSGTAQKHC